jgi:hypothetical protein
MFYEKNGPTSPRRSSFQQSSSSKPITTSRSNHFAKKNEQMPRSKSYKDLLDPPIAHPSYYQQHPSTSYLTNNLTPTITVNHGNGLTEYQRRLLSSNNNFIPDDISSSSTGHLPKPPPGIPNQNAR